MVQNADDAGATTVSFLLDHTSYPSDSILGSNMASFQGPALISANNAVFSPQDLINISRIGQGSKLSQPSSIGRFGLGFNAVYHFTDVPSFVTGDSLVFFDPHARYVPGVSSAQPGLKINYRNAGLAKHFPDLAASYLHFGCNLCDVYPATLFRFPLRTELQGQASEIKPRACLPSDILCLFESLKVQLPHSLLFLKSVTSVRVFEKSAGAHSPVQLYEVTLQPSQSQSPISAFINDCSKGNKKEAAPLSPLLDRLTFHSRTRTLFPALSTATTEVTFVTQDSSCSSSVSWLVVNALGSSKECLEVAASQHLSNSKMIPWVGLACSVTGGTEGKAFCFLPLPISTGLPFHCNAMFELASNRRDIWKGSDLSGSGKQRVEWNDVLLTNVLPSLLGRMLVELSKVVSTSDERKVWEIFPPPPERLQPPWSHLSHAFYSKHLVEDVPVFPTRTSKQLKRVDQVFFLDATSRSSPNLQSLCTSLDIPLAIDCPQWLHDLICRLTPNTLRLSPGLVIKKLREVVATSGIEGLTLILTTSYASALLSYILSGLRTDQSDVSGPPALLLELDGLPILPLMDGKLGLIKTKGPKGNAFIIPQTSHELDILKPMPHLSIDTTSLPMTLLDSLVPWSNVSTLDVNFDTALNETILPNLMPESWRTKDQASYENSLDISWLQALWRLLLDKPVEKIRTITWPVVPVRGNRIATLNSSIVVTGQGWLDDLSDALQHLGVNLLDEEALSSSITGQIQGHFMQLFHSPSLSGVADAMMSSSTFTSALSSLSASQQRELRRFILQPRWLEGLASLKANQTNLLRSLPVFEVHSLGGESEVFKRLSDGLLLPPKLSQDSMLPLLNPALLHNVIEANADEIVVLEAMGVSHMSLEQFSQVVVSCSSNDAASASLKALGLGLARKLVARSRSSSKKDVSIDAMIDAAR
jgi:sacsin